MASAAGTTTTSPSNTARGFSRVVLSSDVFISPEKLTNTPSTQDGLDADAEYDLRNYGCELIQTAGILLKVPQVAMATGQVLFQRYYYSRSFVRHNVEVTAIAAVHLASKIEEAPRRIRDCLNVFHHMKQVRTGRTIGPMVLDQNYVNIKNEVIKAERRLLKELGFCVHVKHPHKIIVTILDQLEQKNNTRLAQFAWNYMNDSFRTDVFMRFSPAVIACSCIFLAARQLQVPLPNNPPWYYVFDANDEQVKEIALTLLRLYAKPKVQWDKLEAAIAEANRRRRDAQVKERLAKEVPSFADEGSSPQLVLPSDIMVQLTQGETNPLLLATAISQPPQEIAIVAPSSAAAVAVASEKEAEKKASRHSRSRSRSRHGGRPKHGRHDHHSRHRHRRHSSTSPGGGGGNGGGDSRSSSRSSSSSSRSRSSSRSLPHIRRTSNHLSNGRGGGGDKSSRKHGDQKGSDSGKYHGENNGGSNDKGSSGRSYRSGRRSSRSRSRDRGHRDRSRTRENSSKATSRRSPPPRSRDGSGRSHHR